MVKEAVFAVPGDLATPTGGYVYDRRIIAELPALGWRTEVLNLGEEFPRPAAATRAAAARQLAALAPGRPIVIDGLAFGVLPQTAETLRASHPLVALVHHPLALETGLSADASAGLRASECAALACARHVIATSAATARILAADYHVALHRLTVVEPGTDSAKAILRDLQPRSDDGVVSLLAVGSVVPRKAFDVLVAALAQLKSTSWRLVIAGDLGRSPATARSLQADIERLGLARRIALRGAVDPGQLALLYAASDLFVLPSRFEGYGMAFAEAIAHGLPVIGTTAGAIPETVPVDAGVLVAPDDVEALAIVLRRLIESPGERARLAAGARAAKLPSWRDQASAFARVLESLA